VIAFAVTQFIIIISSYGMINDGTDGQTDILADKTLVFIIARFAICITHGKKRPTENSYTDRCYFQENPRW